MSPRLPPLIKHSFLFVLTMLLAACSKQKELRVFIWADYVKPELVQRFEQEHQCRVILDTFDSNESLYAKLISGAGGYDILVPSSYMADLMAKQGMLATLDHTKLANLKQVDPAFLHKVPDAEMKHAVPYAVSYGVLGYRKDKVQDAKPTWAMLQNGTLRQKTSLLDDMRETLGAALKSLGHSINTVDENQIAAAADVVIKWKANAVKFDNEQYKGAVDAGEFHLVHGYSGDLYQVVTDNPQVGILVPTEGVVIACDELVIPKDAPSVDLAHQFVDFLLQPDVAAENMEWMGFKCPNLGAYSLVKPEILAHPAFTLSAEVMARSEVIYDVGLDREKYSKAWDRIKSAP
jgi:spermidine/putrescine transport system substrate-binding protein